MADCIIVGAGISGVFTALALQRAGMEVAILERNTVGSESSWAGGGIISPLYPWRYPDAVNQLARYSQQHYPSLLDTLQLESGIDPQYTRNGLLVLDEDEQAEAQRWAEKWQANLQILNQEELHACEPILADKYQQALWMPDIAQLRNPRLVKAMRATLDSRRIELHEHSAVTSLKVNQHKIQGVSVGDEFYPADKVVITGGAWSGRILQQLKIESTIQPVKGQMILLKGEPEQVRRIVLSHGRYVIPRRDGRILVGSTLEHTDFKKELTQDARDELFAAAIDMMPALSELEIEHHWAGLRPGTDNGVPYIGEHPQVEGLFFNAGHYRNGVVLGPASAQLMADIILKNDSVFDLIDYGLDAEH